MTRKFLGWMVMILILASASVLYFSKIGEIPSGFYIDEASTAYNAISIFKTGKAFEKFVVFPGIIAYTLWFIYGNEGKLMGILQLLGKWQEPLFKGIAGVV